jgi:GNAT superfamily N-acetyltransferase
VIRRARLTDVRAIHRLIRELAEYERALPEVTATPDHLRQALFGPDPALFGHVAVRDGRVVGFALWFLNYSTWLGSHGIYLEDLYVTPDMRGQGIGRELLAELARLCVQRGYGRLEWAVLDWNEPAIGFYRSLGAVAMDDWTVHRVTGAGLVKLAASRAEA